MYLLLKEKCMYTITHYNVLYCHSSHLLYLLGTYQTLRRAVINNLPLLCTISCVMSDFNVKVVLVVLYIKFLN